MAYSDYGGYAYKNGERVEDRSDAVLSPEGVQSTPGQWPGWTIEAGRMGGSYHSLLGTGPIFVGLYKQSSVSVFRLGEELDVKELLDEPDSDATWETEWKGKQTNFLSSDYFCNADKPCVLRVDGCRIEIRWTDDSTEDNHYLYVRMEEPDGTVWHGWSGYGVGAGLEGSYEHGGHTTRDREDMLTHFWPDALKAPA